MAVNGATPDLTVLLSVTPEISMKRRNKSKKAKDRLDLQQHDFYERVYDGYKVLAKKEPKRFVVVDASKSIEKVATEVWDVVQSALKTYYGKTKKK